MCWPKRCSAVARHPSHHRAGNRERLLFTTSSATSRSRRRISPESKKKMREIIARDKPVHQGGVVRARRPNGRSPTWANSSRSELVDAIPQDQTDQDLQAGANWFEAVPRPHMTSTGQDRQRVQADESGRRLLCAAIPTARCSPAIYGTAFAKQEEAGRVSQAD